MKHGEEGLTPEEIDRLFPKQPPNHTMLAVGIVFILTCTGVVFFLLHKQMESVQMPELPVEKAEESLRLVEISLSAYQNRLELALLQQALGDYAALGDAAFAISTSIKSLREKVYGSSEPMPYTEEVWTLWEE